MSFSIPAFRSDLLRWFDANARDLPWRAVLPATGRPDPYHVLLSEFMLQQTQVATVIPYFFRFLELFPTLSALADADEQAVLRLWQGLGYYSRARNLLRAAKRCREHFGGRVPATIEQLLELPGVGRYTAGAIASIAHGVAAPIVDGNVVRVLCRLDSIRSDPREKTTIDQLWARAAAIVPKKRPGDLNSAMMELGATVCVPKNPQCLICPVARHCAARAAGIEQTIPPAKQSKPTPLEARTIYCVYRNRDKTVEFAFEQRPSTGRWAGMWQFITRPDDGQNEPQLEIETELGTIAHQLTHRSYRFKVVVARLHHRAKLNATWLALEASLDLPLPKPHVTTRGMVHAWLEARRGRES